MSSLYCCAFHIFSSLLKFKFSVWGQTRPLGIESWNTLSMSHCFSSIFDISRKDNGQSSQTFLLLLLRARESEAIQQLQSHPCPLPCGPACGESLPRAQLRLLQNSRSWTLLLRVKPLSVWNSHWQNPRKNSHWLKFRTDIQDWMSGKILKW